MSSNVPVAVGLVVGAGIIIATLAVYYGGYLPKEPEQLLGPSPRIKIEGLHDRYLVGERLNFTIQIAGACNTPNVIIGKNNKTIFEYKSQPIHCGPSDDDPYTPRINWSAEQLGHADLMVGEIGNYTLTASVYNKNATASFVVDYPEDMKRAISVAANMPEVKAFLAEYPNATTKATITDEGMTDVSYSKEVYLSDSTSSNNNNELKGRGITLTAILNSTTLDIVSLVVSCYPINQGIDADGAYGTDVMTFILQSKTRCFSGIE